jgi:hypothetical protein
MTTTQHRLVWTVFAWVAMSATPAHRLMAQAANASRAPLPARLGTETRAAIERLIDSVGATGLPTSSLADKAAEGVLKGADDRRILAAVQSLARELGDARAVLGGRTEPALLTATASALHAGVATADVRRLVRSTAAGADEPGLGIALVTLVDLVAKRVPASVATESLGELLGRRAPESQYVALRSEVEQDILDGRAPEAAMTARTRAHVRLLDEPAASGRAVPVRRPPDPR